MPVFYIGAVHRYKSLFNMISFHLKKVEDVLYSTKMNMILQNTWKQSVYPMAENMGIDIILPRVSPQPYNHLAFEGYQYAREKGKGKEYNDLMLRDFSRKNKILATSMY